MSSLFASFEPTSITSVTFASGALHKTVSDIVLGKRNCHLLLYGEPGSGKSRVAELLIEHRYPNEKSKSFIYNGGTWDNSCLNAIKGMINVQKMNGQHRNLTVINEVDWLPPGQMSELRGFMDEFLDHHFILTTNHAGKLPSSVINRCSAHLHEMEPPTSVAIKLITFFATRGLRLSLPDALQLATSANGSWRTLEDNVYSILP